MTGYKAGSEWEYVQMRACLKDNMQKIFAVNIEVYSSTYYSPMQLAAPLNVKTPIPA